MPYKILTFLLFIILNSCVTVPVEKKDNSLEKKHVIDVLTKHLQPLKRPNRIIFVDNMPVGPSGKILKRKLREELDVSE